MPVCLVISGPPCTGKSTLATRIARASGWPLLAKDAYKERVFDHLGHADRAWSRRVSALAWDLLLEESARLLGAGASCLVEGNLREPQRRRLGAAVAAARATVLEVECRAQPERLLERYRARAAGGARHPGHVDLEALAEVEAELREPSAAATALGGATLQWDTSAGFDTAALLPALAEQLRRAGEPAAARRVLDAATA
ncbi:MAG: ATP-binding protein [Proteobacteria bacterium]|nr:ATP-binding protein [Pseudomonadota bacterium]